MNVLLSEYLAGSQLRTRDKGRHDRQAYYGGRAGWLFIRTSRVYSLSGIHLWSLSYITTSCLRVYLQVTVTMLYWGCCHHRKPTRAFDIPGPDTLVVLRKFCPSGTKITLKALVDERTNGWAQVNQPLLTVSWDLPCGIIIYVQG